MICLLVLIIARVLPGQSNKRRFWASLTGNTSRKSNDCRNGAAHLFVAAGRRPNRAWGGFRSRSTESNSQKSPIGATKIPLPRNHVRIFRPESRTRLTRMGPGIFMPGRGRKSTRAAFDQRSVNVSSLRTRRVTLAEPESSSRRRHWKPPMPQAQSGCFNRSTTVKSSLVIPVSIHIIEPEVHKLIHFKILMTYVMFQKSTQPSIP